MSSASNLAYFFLSASIAAFSMAAPSKSAFLLASASALILAALALASFSAY
jgi:hypothetical protein